MRMLLEEFGRSLMRVRANDHVGTHLIACIFDAALRDFFGLAERSAHANDCGLIFFGPRPPSGYPSFCFASRSASGRAFHAVIRGFVLLPRNTARNVLFAFMRFPFPYVLRVQTKARCIDAERYHALIERRRGAGR